MLTLEHIDHTEKERAANRMTPRLLPAEKVTFHSSIAVIFLTVFRSSYIKFGSHWRGRLHQLNVQGFLYCMVPSIEHGTFLGDMARGKRVMYFY